MKAAAGLSVLWILFLASHASAAGVNLAWNNCVGGGGLSSRTFACNTNVGGNLLFVSVRPPAGITQWVGFTTEMRFQFANISIPQWWQLRVQTGQTGQCRNGSLTASADFTTNSGCADPYQGSGVGGIGTYHLDDPFPGYVRLALVFAVPPGSEMPLDPGTEYYVARVTINNAKTVGLAFCAGCQVGVCGTVLSVTVNQSPGAPAGDLAVTNTAESNLIAWQSGCVTATQRTTWSGVKMLYR